MKLKTLKDLIDNDGLIHWQRAKAEAIKWVKELRKTEKLIGEAGNVVASKAFERFYNITSEDLK